MTTTDRSGVVLAGGHSRRFGQQDKALAELDGEPMLKRVVERTGSVVEQLLVSCREAQRASFEVVLDPVSASVELVTDPEPGAGPLAGVNAALQHTFGEYVAVVACDIPAVDPEFLAFLFEQASGREAAVPRLQGGTPQPALAVYEAAAMRRVSTALLDEGVRRFRSALDELDVRFVAAEEIEAQTELHTLHNVNTLEELAELEDELR